VQVSDTPRTDAVIAKHSGILQYTDLLRYCKDMTANSEQLETELTEMTQQRDALAARFTPQKPILGSDIENLLSKLETHIAHMPAHQRERQQGELLIRATDELLRIKKAIE
jgi:hypothetical protein